MLRQKVSVQAGEALIDFGWDCRPDAVQDEIVDLVNQVFEVVGGRRFGGHGGLRRWGLTR
jgi:hypothetical protein